MNNISPVTKFSDPVAFLLDKERTSTSNHTDSQFFKLYFAKYEKVNKGRSVIVAPLG